MEVGNEQDFAHCYGKIPRNMKCLALAFKQSTIVADRETYVDRVKKACYRLIDSGGLCAGTHGVLELPFRFGSNTRQPSLA